MALVGLIVALFGFRCLCPVVLRGFGVICGVVVLAFVGCLYDLSVCCSRFCVCRLRGPLQFLFSI